MIVKLILNFFLYFFIAVETESHIRLLTTLLPNWIKMIKLASSAMEYVKIDKASDINVLLGELNEIIKKHSS